MWLSMLVCVDGMASMLIKYICLFIHELQFNTGISSDKIKWGLCQNVFFDMSGEDSVLCTWQFYILAADSSRPSTVPKSTLTWNMCFGWFVSVQLCKRAMSAFSYRLYETIFSTLWDTLWDAYTRFLIGTKKKTLGFVCLGLWGNL